MRNQIIINTEYFLQCAGSCAGCFLSEEERGGGSVNSLVPSSLKKLVSSCVEQGKGKDFFVIGVGRGNNLQLPDKEIVNLGELITSLENMIQTDELVFEVSTSLVGKIDTQIEKAKKLLTYSKNIYFNIVVNSELTSKQFWVNVKKFYQSLKEERESWGWTDKTGDLLVLNINPMKLPELDAIREFKDGVHSAINISLFPFEENYLEVSEEVLINLNNWIISVSDILKDSDFNIKNQVKSFNFEINSLRECIDNIEKTKGTYFFIDKNGEVAFGQPSIMGEVDYPRLIEKYKLNINPKFAFMQMQKNTPCSKCEFSKECLMSGAYLNMLANAKKLKKTNHCPSGYKEFFKFFSKERF